MSADQPGTGGAAPDGARPSAFGRGAWRIALLALALVAVLMLLGYRLLLAAPTPAAWASCLWQDVPMSAANWAAMDSPESSGAAGAPLPAELLKARLLGACAEPLAPFGKAVAPPPVWADVQSALAAQRPDRIAEDRSDPRAFVCEVFFADDAALHTPAAHDWGYGDFNTGPIIGRRRHAERSRHYGQVLNAASSVRFCRLIGPDGRPGRDRFQRAPLADGGAG